MSTRVRLFGARDRLACSLASTALVVLLAFAACKDSRTRSQQPATQPPSAQEPATPFTQPPATQQPPTLPSPATQAGSATPPTLDVIPDDTLTPQSLSETEATDVLPKLGGSVLIPMKASADHHQVHGTWCLPGSAADTVANDIAAKLTAAGWKNVATRGVATKAGLSAERGGYHASYIVSASSIATCAAPTHYFASLTMFKLRD